MATGRLRFGEYELDSSRRLLMHSGKSVPLYPKAFDLLEHLIVNRGRVLTKDELLEHVWPNQYVEENNLTVQISAIRKAFGERKGEQTFIATLPGRGYSFVEKVERVDDAGSSNTELSITRGNAILSPEAFFDSDVIFGRTEELAEIFELLRRGTRALVLTGAGGSGKTTLARAVATQAEGDFPDGIFFVELAAVDTADLLVSAVAQTLDIKESGGKSAFEAVTDFLRRRRALLILDNFEQIIAAAPEVLEFLVAIPALQILITSRLPVNLKIAYEFRVSPLDLPPIGRISFAELSDNPSVKLFNARARAAKPAFALTNENIGLVAEICRRLDGLPLAIELAAARVKLLALQSILDRLEHALTLLTGGSTDLPKHQQTMLDTIRWSYELLDDDEQILFRRLSVFVGGCTVEAAEFVASRSEPTIPAAGSNRSVLDLLTSLAEKNLLNVIEQPDGNARLRALEVVREFALRMLRESGEFEHSRKVHTDYFLALAEEAGPFLLAIDGSVWLERLERDHDNLRSALSWSLEKDSGIAARIAAALGSLWVNHSHLSEGLRWLEAALKATENTLSETRLKLLSTCGYIQRVRGDFRAARRHNETGLAESRKLNNAFQICASLHGLGALAVLRTDYEPARVFYHEALDLAREKKDGKAISYMLNALVDLEMCQGNWPACRPLIEEGLALAIKADDARMLITLYLNFGIVDYNENLYHAAAENFSESLRRAAEMSNKVFVAYSIDGFAALAAQAGDYEQTAKLANAAEALREEIGWIYEPSHEIFRNEDISKGKAAIGESTFAALSERGKATGLDEAMNLVFKGQPQEGKSDGYPPPHVPTRRDEVTEIVIENRTIERIVIESSQEAGALENDDIDSVS
jgi:predicted ATPase/DNA-binding winged helix-turn-helix (wHTH) protein